MIDLDNGRVIIDSSNPFILVLAGLSYLKIRLNLNYHRPLAQRIIMRYQLQPLSKENIIAHDRFTIARMATYDQHIND
ncbi:hypothetical protein [Virgibacillus dokdonensis]|uniref:hypothetical protein n=1 Tax=Virgibacillus dokdonensis TaxID=302167 RepID=UPI001C6F3015|nr:hypothetical protein [Virgibacillus dokdonensis]